MQRRSAMWVVSVCVVVLSVPGIAAAKSKQAGGGDAKAAIEATNAKMSEAFAKRDATALAAFYTEDAIVFPPDADMVKGRAAIAELWKKTQESGVKSAKLETLDVGTAGNVAYETGTVTLTIEPPGKAAATVKAKYVVVWKRQADGSWQLHRDIWNALPAAK